MLMIISPFILSVLIITCANKKIFLAACLLIGLDCDSSFSMIVNSLQSGLLTSELV